MADEPKPTSTTFIVSRYDPPHWRSVLATTNQAEAEAMLKTLGSRAASKHSLRARSASDRNGRQGRFLACCRVARGDHSGLPHRDGIRASVKGLTGAPVAPVSSTPKNTPKPSGATFNPSKERASDYPQKRYGTSLPAAC